MSDEKPRQLAPLAVPAGQSPAPATGSRVVPVYRTTDVLAKRMAALAVAAAGKLAAK